MVGDEIGDVEEPLESVVLAVIFFCMEKVFGDPCRVLSKTGIEEGESEVEQHGEGKVDDDAVVWKVDGSVIFGSWIVVGVMAMLEHVEREGRGPAGTETVRWSGASGSVGLAFGAGGGMVVGSADVGDGVGGVGPVVGTSWWRSC